MEDKYPIKEIKVMDGVYIWKPEKKIENNSSNNMPNQSNQSNQTSNNNNNNLIAKKTSIGENNYLCHGEDELIKIYEIEFEEIGNKIQSLFQSNEDMMEFDPHDYDLIQAREENLQIIDKKLEEIIKIQKKMKSICEKHPLVEVDIFEYFGIGKSIKGDYKDKDEVKKEENKNNSSMNKENIIENNINSLKDKENNKEKNNTNDNKEKNNKTQNDNIITEIEI